MTNSDGLIWLVGSKGMLGTEIYLLLEKSGLPVVGTDREVDITDAAHLTAAFKKLAEKRPISWIINCAAYTAVDKAEDDVETCRSLNVQGAANIAAIASNNGARLIHISTDYVFDGKGNRPYREEVATAPIGVYGLTKRDGEIAVLENNSRSYIIRTAWLYGRHGNNFVHTMLRLMNERDEVKVVNDQWGSPTWTFDLASAVLAVIKKNRVVRKLQFLNNFLIKNAKYLALDRCFAGLVRQPTGLSNKSNIPFGIYHFTNEGNITWYDFAKEIYRQGREHGRITKDCAVNPCTSAEFPAKVKRPAYSVLDKSKIKATLGIEVPAWDKSLKEFFKSND